MLKMGTYINDEKRKNKLKWFNDARFGMFIHWGLDCIRGTGEWAVFRESIPSSEFSKYADSFNPQYFDPREWARAAKRAGMKYMVLTTKHHSGFCLFDSAHTDYTSVKTAAKRDFVREYVEACRAEGLGVGLYFSLQDWSFPAAFKGPVKDPEGWDKLVAYAHNQVRELMTNYGKIDILWYDGCGFTDLKGIWENGKSDGENWKAVELNTMVRELQPEILINDRSGIKEDFGTPEQTIALVAERDHMEECCLTINDSWGHNPSDYNWKSSRELIRNLIMCAANGNNLLLNVGPDRDGLITAPEIERLYDIGGWLDIHKEAIYGTDLKFSQWWNLMNCPGVYTVTTKDTYAYVVLDRWDVRNGFKLTSIKNNVLSASVLATEEQLDVRREGRIVSVTGLPHYPPSNFFNVIKLELDGPLETQFWE